jgi:hypothetical protein
MFRGRASKLCCGQVADPAGGCRRWVLCPEAHIHHMFFGPVVAWPPDGQCSSCLQVERAGCASRSRPHPSYLRV